MVASNFRLCSWKLEIARRLKTSVTDRLSVYQIVDKIYFEKSACKKQSVTQYSELFFEIKL